MNRLLRSAAKIILLVGPFFYHAACNHNRPPVISGIVRPDSVGTGDTATVVCNAQDPDVDNLHYNWTAPDGGTVLDTTMNTLRWIAPGLTGTYRIVVAVSDGVNSAVDTTISLKVTPYHSNQPPAAVTLGAPANITRTSVDLVWSRSPDSDFDRYEIHRSLQANFTPGDSTKSRVVLSSIDTTYTATGLTPGSTYYFKVVVANIADLTTSSNQVSATTPYFSKLSSVQLPGRPAGLDVSNDLALIADRDGGLQIVTIANPQSPMKIGSYELEGYAWANDVYVQRPYAYTAFSDSGLHIVDFSNPANPVRAAAIDTIKSVYSIFAFGPYAYLSSSDKLFRVVDIHLPTQPVLRGSCFLPDTATDVFVAGTYALAACGFSGMRVVDVSTQDNPIEVIGIATIDKCNKVYVSGGYAFLATGSSGLEIVDITRPTNPVPVATLGLPGPAYDVWVSGNYAFLACWDKGLQVVDVRDPRVPVLRYSMDLPGSFVNGVVVSGSYVYLTDWNYGFIVLSY